MSGKVLIVGRPNVGKSSLFNRIAGGRRAIVEDQPGVTRDLLEANCEWKNVGFSLVDTGGLVPDTEEDILRKIREVVQSEIATADAVIFLTSVRDGITPLDEEIAKILYPYKDKVILAVNKVDTPKEEIKVSEFYSLGFEEVFPVSAVHGIGVGELLDEVVKRLPKEGTLQRQEGIKIAFVGRPNVGKSSLLNALIGKERVIVSDVAGTTRDSIEVPFEWNGEKFILVDTAGIRRPSKVEYGVEFYSVGRSLKAIDRADVSCLVIDCTEGVSRQDKRIAGLIERRYKGCVIVVNKIDVCDRSREDLLKEVRRELFYLDYAPVVFTSAVKGEGVEDILKQVKAVYKDYSKQHKTSFINRAVKNILREKAPPNYRGKPVKVFYAFQERSKPPTVVIVTNYPEGWKENYRKFFLKRLREEIGINLAPLKLVIKGRD